MTRVPHQLIVHLDYWHGDAVEIRWNYPFTSIPIPEQVIRLVRSGMTMPMAKNLATLHQSMIARAPPLTALRVPHGYIETTRSYGILTVIIQDQRRDLPVIRLYYTEALDAGPAAVEKEIRIDGRDAATLEELQAWGVVHKVACKLAWNDFQNRFKPRPK